MSRMTYLRSPLSNIRPRRGPWPNPGPPRKKPFIAFGPNTFSISFLERCSFLPTHHLLTDACRAPRARTRSFLRAPLPPDGRSPRDRRASGQPRRRRARSRAPPAPARAPPPRERPEKLPLLALLGRRPTRPLPRTGLGNPRQSPRRRSESRHQQEGNGQDQEEREEVEGGTNHKEQEQSSCHQPHRK